MSRVEVLIDAADFFFNSFLLRKLKINGMYALVNDKRAKHATRGTQKAILLPEC